MSKSPKTAAVIDIGSNEMRLHIAQSGKINGFIKYLERLSYPLSLGRDTFHGGKLSFEKVDKACEVINNFKQAALSYGVSQIRTVASTAVREAKNKDYIIDQIKIKTGVDVEVINDNDEKLRIYKLLAIHAEEQLKESTLLVYIGTGSIGVSLFTDGRMPRTWNIRAGSLRMGELFGDLQEYTKDFYKLMEEYLATYTYKLREDLPESINHFIVSGPEVEVMARLVGVENLYSTPLFEISRQTFTSLYEKIKRKSTDKIATDYNLNIDKADSLLPAVCTFKDVFGQTNAKSITATCLLPSDAALYELLHPKQFASADKRFEKGAVQSARALCKRHNVNLKHGELVRDFALKIFDKLRKLHGLGARDKLLLTLASLLHDIGACVNTLDHHLISYQIIRHADFVGLIGNEQEIIALICRYHSSNMPKLSESRYANLDPESKVRVSKLAAMLRLSDALDRSHTQKYDSIETKITDNALIVTVTTDKDISLEKWSFAKKGRFFAEVFGLKAELKVKKP